MSFLICTCNYNHPHWELDNEPRAWYETQSQWQAFTKFGQGDLFSAVAHRLNDYYANSRFSTLSEIVLQKFIGGIGTSQSKRSKINRNTGQTVGQKIIIIRSHSSLLLYYEPYCDETWVEQRGTNGYEMQSRIKHANMNIWWPFWTSWSRKCTQTGKVERTRDFGTKLWFGMVSVYVKSGML